MPATAASNYSPPDIELDPTDPIESAVAAPPSVAAPLSAAPATPLPVPEYEVRAHVRRQRTHQPLRVLPMSMLMGFVLVCQVVAFLWIQGMSMKARNTSNQIDHKIDATRLQIERTRNSIAERLADDSQIGAWAGEGQWHPAEQSAFDDARDRKPYQPPQPQDKAKEH